MNYTQLSLRTEINVPIPANQSLYYDPPHEWKSLGRLATRNKKLFLTNLSVQFLKRLTREA